MSDWQGMNWIRKDKRLAIYLRDGMACVYCGDGVEDEVTLTLDHIVPRSSGGGNEASNLVTSCRSCNSARGNTAVELFAAQRVLVAIDALTSRPLAGYRVEAKRIIARRAHFREAVEEAAA